MAEFSSDIDPNRDLVNQFNWFNPSFIDNSNFNLHSFLGFSNEFAFSHHQASELLPGNLAEKFPTMAVSQAPVIVRDEFHENKKRKSCEISESSSGITYPPDSGTGIKRKNNSGSRGKRVKSRETIEEEKLKDVVHVRARRGQATDSHSLAERVRRGKINERLRCLQDIVPGCYKTMGMAVMLDEIINYVQSLQNQVEFLSMKLTAASSFYDFNSESDAMERMQRAKAYEAQALERFLRDGYSNLPQ